MPTSWSRPAVSATLAALALIVPAVVGFAVTAHRGNGNPPIPSTKDAPPAHAETRNAPAVPPVAGRFFETKVRPVLAEACLKCHGARKARGGLRLDSRAALLRGGDRGPAVVPGDPDASLLIQAVRYTHEQVKMPPGERLSDATADLLAEWVRDGAVWPEDAATPPKEIGPHWAFKPVAAVEPPADPSGWSRGPVDRFIRAGLREHDLQPTPPADKATLLRRVTFDLTGLPPTPEEVDAFLKDVAPDAYEKVVDRLLDSPRYGERWGRHWLDVARYADTGGFEADHLYPNAWRYRDYVIRSLNADKPFDRFIQEQVAGDELWPDDPDAAIATALYCVGPALAESAMVSGQLEYEWLTDAADTTGAAFLGLTFGCARCHDHKYDPITQKDYYALQAVFAASDRPYPEKVRLLRIKALNGLLSDAPVPEALKADPRCTSGPRTSRASGSSTAPGRWKSTACVAANWASRARSWGPPSPRRCCPAGTGRTSRRGRRRGAGRRWPAGSRRRTTR